jgi:hypothetical protein
MRNDLALGDLAAEICVEHERAYGKAREALEHARRAGELLLEAKARAGHGGWLGWLQANVPFSERTAQGYMRLARQWDALQGKSATVADLGLREALALLAAPAEPTTPDPAPAAAPSVYVEGLADNTTFGIAPSPTARLTALADDASLVFVDPSSHAGYFYVSRMTPDLLQVHSLYRPIRFDMVAAALEACGVPRRSLAWSAEPVEPFDRHPWSVTSSDRDVERFARLRSLGLSA